MFGRKKLEERLRDSVELIGTVDRKVNRIEAGIEGTSWYGMYVDRGLKDRISDIEKQVEKMNDLLREVIDHVYSGDKEKK